MPVGPDRSTGDDGAGSVGIVGAGQDGGARAGAGSVGIVGAGQLARMTCEAASALGIPAVVLAEHDDDSAAAVAHAVVIGSPLQEKALRQLAERCDVVTFDHEQVDLDLLAELEDAGATVRPGTAALRMSVDKAVMRDRLARDGVAVPPFRDLGRCQPREAVEAIEAFAGLHGWPVVVKAARGGYDGKGVWPVQGPGEALAVCERAAASQVPLLVEEMVPIDVELAVLVARRPGGEVVAWPAVETAQVGGVCREVLLPGRLPREVADRAVALAAEVAEVAGSVGVMAVEMFWSRGGLMVNEVAARPHNSGHWTIEGAVTSQFENHLRAVLDLPLGDTGPTATAVASVNVFGSPPPSGGTAPGPGGASRPWSGQPAVSSHLPGSAPAPERSLAPALAVPGAHVHLYGKAPRPGRKLGHVTVCGTDPHDVRSRAWTAARALGTPVPYEVGAPPVPGTPVGR